MRAKEFTIKLDEIKMSTANLRQLAANINALAGMEFEMIVPNVTVDEDDPEPDWDEDESADDIDDIERFFDDGEHNSTYTLRRAIREMRERYASDRNELIAERFGDVANEYILAALRDDYSEEDIILMNLEDEFSTEEAKKIMQAVSDGSATDEEADAYSNAESKVDEKFESLVDESLRFSDSYYDTAYDSFADDVDYDERDWLRDQGIETMRDVLNEYDLSWPYYTQSNNEDLAEVAGDFEMNIGRTTKYSSEYHAETRDKSSYIVEPDGSLRPGSGDAGLEFVSPPLPVDELLDDLKEVVAWAKKRGCYTGKNEKTGLHINVSVPNYDLKKLDYIKLVLLSGDEVVLKQFGRLANTYAENAMQKIREKISAKADEIPQLLSMIKQGLALEASKSIHTGFTQKYTSVNTKEGWVEFRSPGGDWLNADIVQIENTLLRYVVALDAAVNPEKYKQEYLKKLYQILSPKSDNDPIAYFARYAAGELPQSALKSFVRQIQLQRQIKKQPNANKKYWWEVLRDGNVDNTPGVEVVASSREEALNIAARNWNMNPAQLSRAAVRALRPYESEPTATPQAQASTRGGEFTGRWLIVAPDGEIIHTIGGVGNNARSALTVAQRWVEQNPGTGVRASQIEVVPELR